MAGNIFPDCLTRMDFVHFNNITSVVAEANIVKQIKYFAKKLDIENSYQFVHAWMI